MKCCQESFWLLSFTALLALSLWTLHAKFRTCCKFGSGRPHFTDSTLLCLYWQPLSMDPKARVGSKPSDVQDGITNAAFSYSAMCQPLFLSLNVLVQHSPLHYLFSLVSAFPVQGIKEEGAMKGSRYEQPPQSSA